MIQSVIFFGTRCDFADLVADQLLEQGYEIRARIVPGYPSAPHPYKIISSSNPPTVSSQLPMMNQPGDVGRSSRAAEPFPTVMIHDHLSEETVNALRSFSADLAIVCCYPKRLPLMLFDGTKFGGVNIHPSLLPKYRGPEPLFWVYRNGETETGVTIHRVDANLDTGAILGQERLAFSIGTPGDELWMRSAGVGATLLTEVLSEDVTSSGTHQSDAEASYQSWPGTQDLVIDPAQWNAWHVFHFCRGVIPLGYTPSVLRNGAAYPVTGAYQYADNIRLIDSVNVDQSIERIKCRDGWVAATLGAPAE